MQQVLTFYFEFLDLDFSGSKVPAGTTRTIFYPISQVFI